MLTDLLHYTFLQHALGVALLSSAATALFSVHISLKNLSYMGDALSHVAFAGIALALLVGLPLDLTAIVVVGGCGILIGWAAYRFKLQESHLTTIFLSVAMAIGIILIASNRSRAIDIEGFLFGDVLLTTSQDMFWLAVILLLNIAFLLVFYKPLFYLCFNEEIARVYRLPVTLTYLLFLFMVAVTIVVSVKVVGVILITAQLILPGLSALNITMRMKWAIPVSVLLSATGSMLGFTASYLLNLPSGACMVLAMFVIFVCTLLWRARK